MSFWEGDGSSSRRWQTSPVLQAITLLQSSDQVSLDERSQDSESYWLPSLVTRPVLPLEEFVFRAAQPSALGAVRHCQIQGLPLAAVAALPEPENGKGELFGTSLHVKNVTELADGSLQVEAVGLHPFRVESERVKPHRLGNEKVALVKNVRVTWLSGEVSEDASPVASATRERIMAALRQIRFAADGDWEAAPAEACSFSWWVASRLPLPASARGLLLRVDGAKARLDVCAEVLAAALHAKEPERVDAAGDLATAPIPFRSRL